MKKYDDLKILLEEIIEGVELKANIDKSGLYPCGCKGKGSKSYYQKRIDLLREKLLDIKRA